MSCDTCGTLQTCAACRAAAEARIVKRVKRTTQLNELHRLRDRIMQVLALNADVFTREDVTAVIASLQSVRETWYPLPETTDRTG